MRGRHHERWNPIARLVVADTSREDGIEAGDFGGCRRPGSINAICERLFDGFQIALEHVTGNRRPRHNSRRREDRELLSAHVPAGASSRMPDQASLPE